MQCFIPFSEEVLEQHPDLMVNGLVPFCEAYIHRIMQFEVVSPEKPEHLEPAGFLIER